MSYLVTDIETVPTSGVGKIPEPTPEVPDPFPPLPCHVPVVVGNLLFDDVYMCIDSRVLSQKTRSEVEMLQVFSSFAEGMNLVTWNGRSFDVPVIVLRCLRHGIPLAWYFREKFGPRYRYNDGKHYDVMEQVSNFGATKNLSLNDVAQLIGLPGKLGVDGADVREMWEGGREAEVENYCMTDVVQTAFVWLRFEYTRGRFVLDHYRKITSALIERCRTNALRYGELLDKTDMKILLLGGDDGDKADTVARPDAAVDPGRGGGLDGVHGGDGRDVRRADEPRPGDKGSVSGVRQEVGSEDSPSREGGV